MNDDHNEDLDAEDMLFDGGERSIATGRQTDDWARAEDDDWAPQKDVGDLEDYIGDELSAEFDPAEMYGTPAKADDQVRRNPMPSTGDESDPLPGMPRSPHLEEQAAASQREALPSLRDAPVHAPRLIQESRPMAWILPGSIFLLGSSAGGIMYLTDTNPIFGGISIGLSVVGALFLRLLMKS